MLAKAILFAICLCCFPRGAGKARTPEGEAGAAVGAGVGAGSEVGKAKRPGEPWPMLRPGKPWPILCGFP